MARTSFLERLQNRQILISDGATGTNLQMRGMRVGAAPEALLLDNPEMIRQLHRDFVAAGANILLTDTFGGTPVRLEHAGLRERAAEINRLAAIVAREASGSADVLVAGSMGPTGQLLEPLGPLSADDATANYAEQARGLAEGGADLLVIETMFDLAEATAAIRGARATTTLPIVCSFSFDMGSRTMMGHDPAGVARALTDLGVDVVGVNCGRSLDENLENLRAMRAATDLPLWMKPNAGLPHMGEDDVPIYDVSPEQMGQHARLWLEAGASIIGGCCGSTPEHLRHIAQALASVAAAGD